jgi:ankyrin repeat protein
MAKDTTKSGFSGSLGISSCGNSSGGSFSFSLGLSVTDSGAPNSAFFRYDSMEVDEIGKLDSMETIANLPPDLLGKIFQYFIYDSFVFRCRLVCTHFANAIDNSLRPISVVLYNDLYLSPVKTKTEQQTEIVLRQIDPHYTKFSQVEHLNISYVNMWSEDIYSVKFMSHFKHAPLKIFGCHGTYLSLKFIQSIAKMFPTINVIYAESYKYVNDCIAVRSVSDYLHNYCQHTTTASDLEGLDHIKMVHTNFLTTDQPSRIGAMTDSKRLQLMEQVLSLGIPFRKFFTISAVQAGHFNTARYLLKRFTATQHPEHDLLYTMQSVITSLDFNNAKLLSIEILQLLINQHLEITSKPFCENALISLIHQHHKYFDSWKFVLSYFGTSNGLFDINKGTGREYSSVLYTAIRERADDSLLNALIQHGADINAKNGDGSNCLHMYLYNLAHLKQKKIPLFLLKEELILQPNNDQVYPIHIAAVSCPPSIIKLLVKAGAKLDTPIKAYLSGHYLLKIPRPTNITTPSFTRLYYENESDITIEPIHLVLLNYDCTSSTSLDNLRYLLSQQREKFADLSRRDAMGRHLVHYMHHLSQLEIYNEICHHKFDDYINCVVDCKNRSLLSYKIIMGSTIEYTLPGFGDQRKSNVLDDQLNVTMAEFATFVETTGAKLDTVDKFGLTPLLLAANNHVAAYMAYIIPQVNTYQLNDTDPENGYTCLHYIAHHTSNQDYRDDYNDGVYPISVTRILVQLLLDYGMDIHKTDKEGQTAEYYLKSRLCGRGLVDLQLLFDVLGINHPAEEYYY